MSDEKNNFKILAFLLSFPACVCVGNPREEFWHPTSLEIGGTRLQAEGCFFIFPRLSCVHFVFSLSHGEGGGGWHKEEIRIERDLTQSNISQYYSKSRINGNYSTRLQFGFGQKRKHPQIAQKKRKHLFFISKTFFYFEGNRSVSTHFWATKKLRIMCRKSRADPVYSSSFVVVPSKKPNSEKLAATAH